MTFSSFCSPQLESIVLLVKVISGAIIFPHLVYEQSMVHKLCAWQLAHYKSHYLEDTFVQFRIYVSHNSITCHFCTEKKTYYILVRLVKSQDEGPQDCFPLTSVPRFTNGF